MYQKHNKNQYFFDPILKNDSKTNGFFCGTRPKLLKRYKNQCFFDPRCKNIRKTYGFSNLGWVPQTGCQPASQPASQPTSQPTTQPSSQPHGSVICFFRMWWPPADLGPRPELQKRYKNQCFFALSPRKHSKTYGFSNSGWEAIKKRNDTCAWTPNMFLNASCVCNTQGIP